MCVRPRVGTISLKNTVNGPAFITQNEMPRITSVATSMNPIARHFRIATYNGSKIALAYFEAAPMTNASAPPSLFLQKRPNVDRPISNAIKGVTFISRKVSSIKGDIPTPTAIIPAIGDRRRAALSYERPAITATPQPHNTMKMFHAFFAGPYFRNATGLSINANGGG